MLGGSEGWLTLYRETQTSQPPVGCVALHVVAYLSNLT